MVRIFATATPGYLERDIVDLGGIWKRPAAQPAGAAGLSGAAQPAGGTGFSGAAQPAGAPANTPAGRTITRVWHGATRAEDADRYLCFLQTKGVQDYLRTPGILDVRIGRRVEGNKAHFWTISTWKDMESIGAFAGDPVDKARYYPEDEGFLLEFEPTVLHYETYPVEG